MFPPYTSAPPRSGGGALRCCRSTKSRRCQWPVAYRRVIYRRTIRRSLAVKLKIHLSTRCSPPLVTQNRNPLKIQSPLLPDMPVSLPEIEARLYKLRSTNDYASINAFLATVNTLFMKFRDATGDNNYVLCVDLNYCLDNFGKALFKLFKQTASLIDDGIAGNASIQIRYMESQRLCCSILYSLSFNELPRFLKKHMNEWMVEFTKYITFPAPPAAEAEGVVVVALAELRAAVCDYLTLCIIKEEELFECYLIDFAPAALDLLSYSSSPQGRCREQLCVTVSTFKFLTAVSKTSHHILLSKDVVLERIYQSIIVPHLMLRDDEEELFEINPTEFIRKDLEETHMNPIKRFACELLEGIAIHYKYNIEKGLYEENDRCFGRFINSDPKSNWKYVYSSFCLAISLATKNTAAGGTSVSPDILNVEDFFFDFIFLKVKYNDLDITSFPMIQAVILKFIILFRNQLSNLNHYLVFLLPFVTRLLTSPHYVVCSYAARCIEELFSVNDDSTWFWIYSSRILRLSKAGYTLSTLVSNLFGALSNPGSAENLYVMKCIMRIVLVGDLTVDVASLCIQGLTTILQRVCQNPRNVLFNHYLFESLTGLIRRICFLSNQLSVNERPSKEEISLASLLERKLYPCLQYILARDIRELFTYAFRLLVELVDLNRPLLPEEYHSQVFDILQLPNSWVNQANVPAKGFLPLELNIPSVVYNKLVLSSAVKDHGYYVLNTVIENLGFEVISPFVSQIWVSLFNRLQNQRTEKSVRKIIVFMSLFLLKDDPRNIVGSLNTAVQPNAFQSLLEQFWIPNVKLIENPIDLKLATIASTRLMSASPDIFDFKLRGKMLDCIATVLSSRTMDDESQVQDVGVYSLEDILCS